jgi:hypothetical protein
MNAVHRKRRKERGAEGGREKERGAERWKGIRLEGKQASEENKEKTIKRKRAKNYPHKKVSLLIPPLKNKTHGHHNETDKNK